MVKVSKSKSINRYKESKNILKIQQKAIVLFLVKREYFLRHPVAKCQLIQSDSALNVSKVVKEQQ